MFCQEVCEDTADCIQGFECRDQRCWPADSNTNCDGNQQCVSLFSGWLMSCADTSGCDGGAAGTQACIDVGGEGRCALIPGEFIQCASLNMEEVEVPAFGAEGTVTACGQPRAICNDDRFCQLPCRGDADCSGEYPRCDVDSGLCKCTGAA
ncbi:MAG: hypothetical protein R3F60_22100 [bacterium]